MAWEELLKQQTGNDPKKTEPDGKTTPERETLIAQICGDTAKTTRETAQQNGTEEPPAPLSDGYVRRTPVQKYTTAPGYNRKRVGKVIQAVVVLVLLALLVLALFKSGLIRWS